MYHLYGSIILKTIDPYFRKYLVSNTLNSSDYLYLETFIYTGVLLIVLLFSYFHKKSNVIETFKNFQNVKMRDIVVMVIMSLFWIYSSLKFYENESKNSPFINTVMIRGGPLIGILIVGIFFYKESYSWKQIIGMIMTLFGIYLLMDKSIINKTS
jgi:drug/metabolite transporter (DMT)-like permease